MGIRTTRTDRAHVVGASPWELGIISGLIRAGDGIEDASDREAIGAGLELILYLIADRGRVGYPFDIERDHSDHPFIEE